MLWPYLWCILLLSPNLHGGIASGSEAFESAAREVKRDPAHLLETLALRLKQPYADRRSEIADLALHAAALAELGDIEQLQERAPILKKALDEAQAAGFHAPAFHLLLVQAYILENARQTAAARATYEAVIAQARAHDMPRYELQALYEYSFALQDEGALQEGLQRQNEANQLVIDRPDIDPLEKHIFWAQNAMSLHFSGSYAGAEQLYNQSIAYFAAEKLDFLLATYLYNRGTMYADWDQESKALQDFQAALVLARRLHHEALQGSILASLAGQHELRKNYEEGLREAREALAIFERSHDHVWQANLWRRIAALETGRGRWNEVEKAAQEALKFFQDPDSIDRSALFKMLATAAAAKNDFRGAYKALTEYERLEKIRTEQKSSDNFARERVKMGLLVEEQKNALLQKDNELKEQKLKASRWILALASGVSALLMFTLALLFLLQKKSREIEVRKDRMDRILSNIEDAILTLDHRLEIEPEYSAFAGKLLEGAGALQGLPGLPLLQRSIGLADHERVLIEETLRACLGEDKLTWDFNSGHLPIAWETPERSLTLHWQAFYAKQQITGYLLSMRDVTQSRQLEAQLKSAELESQGMQIKLKELLAADRAAVGKLIDEIRFALADADRHAAFARRIHTLKGNARTLQLKALASTLHRWEDGFHEEPAQELKKHCEQYESLLKDMRGTSTVFAGGVLPIMSRLAMELKRQLEARSALRLQLDVRDGVVDWPTSVQAELQTILLHACTNAIDHGFLEGGPLPETAIIQVEALPLDHGFQLVVRDNGRGLAWERLNHLAAASGFTPNAEQSVADVVFLDRISTAQTVTATSGRGVGLAAIKEIVDRWGGRVHLQDHPGGRGSQLMIKSPWT